MSIPFPPETTNAQVNEYLRDVYKFLLQTVQSTALGGTGQSTYSQGDLLVGNASNSLGRLAVGADDDVLIADSGEALGARWGLILPANIDLSQDFNFTGSLQNDGYDVRRIAEPIQERPDVVYLEEDFPRGVASGEILGEVCFVPIISGANAEVIAIASTVDRFGLVECRTGSTSTGRAQVANTYSGFYFGNGSYSIEWIAAIPILSTPAQRFYTYLGFIDATATAGLVDGAYFLQADDINSGAFRLITLEGGVGSIIDTNITPVAGTYYKFRIEVNANASEVEFFINDVSVGTITTNIPNGSTHYLGMGAGVEKAVGATSRSLVIDRCRFQWVPTNPR